MNFRWKQVSTIVRVSLRRRGETLKTGPKPLKSKGDINCFLWLRRRSALWVPYRTRQSTKNIIYPFCSVERCCKYKRPQMEANNFWILHDDNAPSHPAGIVLDYLIKCPSKYHRAGTIFTWIYIPTVFCLPSWSCYLRFQSNVNSLLPEMDHFLKEIK